MKKWIVARSRGLLEAFVALLMLVGAVVSFNKGHDAGQKEGLDMFFEGCYTMGGFVMDEAGRVVQCRGLGKMPQEEQKNLQKPLDKGSKV